MSGADSSPRSWPLLVRCVKRSAGDLEHLSLVLESGTPLSDEDKHLLIAALLDASGEPPTLKCPRVSHFAARDSTPGELDHALALVSAMIALDSFAPRDEPPSKMKRKSLFSKAFPRDHGIVVVHRSAVEPLTLEHSPQRCTSFGSARPRHHDLMAPDQRLELDTWIQQAVEIFAGELVRRDAFYRILTPTCTSPAPHYRPCVAFADLINVAHAHCADLKDDEWHETCSARAEDQRQRLDQMQQLVQAATLHTPPAYATRP